MEKTKFLETPDPVKVLEGHLRDFRSILTIIAMQQPDMCVNIGAEDMASIPAGTSLEVSFDPMDRTYTFRVILPSPQAATHDRAAVVIAPE